MSVDVRGHTVPAGDDAPSRAALLQLALSIGDPIPVANATARAQKLVDLAAEGIVPSTSTPVFFWRADAQPGSELEVTTDGTTFRPYAAADTMASGNALFGNYTGQALRTASGLVSITTNASSIGTVTLPVPWTNGLKGTVLTSTHDTIMQLRIVGGVSATAIQVVARTNTGTGAGAATFGVQFFAQGW